MELPKVPSISAIIQFVVLWIVVAFLVKLLVPADWRAKLFGIN